MAARIETTGTLPLSRRQLRSAVGNTLFLGVTAALNGAEKGAMHTFYWGDWHRDSVLGPERAARISPAASALKRGMRFNQHHDAPVALPNSIIILHSQVNRVTRSGKVLGPEQRVGVMDALKSITIHAAWTHFEEATKGSLETSKRADLVILDKNPLKIEALALKDLKVLETIKEGKNVYRRGN